MDICPVCNRASAETNHYTKKLVCYNRTCGYEEGKSEKIDEAVRLKGWDLVGRGPERSSDLEKISKD